MGQEQFAGPDYFTEFDPEKFLRDMRAQAETPDDAESSESQSSDSRGDSDA